MYRRASLLGPQAALEAVLGGLKGAFWEVLGGLGLSWGGWGGPGVVWVYLGGSKGGLGRVLGQSWGGLEGVLGGLGGVLGGDLGPFWGILGPPGGIREPLGDISVPFLLGSYFVINFSSILSRFVDTSNT